MKLKTIEDLLTPSTSRYQDYDNLNHSRTISSIGSTIIQINNALGIQDYNFDVASKLYVDQDHGETTAEKYIWVEAKRHLYSFDRESGLAYPNSSKRIIYALSGIVRQRQQNNLLLFPTLDLEIKSSDEEIFTYTLERLMSAGFTGNIISSGFSYHYFADFPMEYGSDYWKVLGHALMQLIDERDISVEAQQNIYNAKTLGDKLMSLEDESKINSIQLEIQKCFQSLPTGLVRKGLLLDPRWLGHKLRLTELGVRVNSLRIVKGKGHSFDPYLKGCIY
jgi:hypothetical protein